ncbi:MAG: helix-turn-helix transcriptional regulator [Microthrixaceae bacterium]
MDFSKRLKQIRKQKKLSVAEVALKSGVAPSSYQEWEQGRRILDVEVYFKLAEALEVSPGELIRGKNKSKEFQVLIEKVDLISRELQAIKNTLLSSEF